MSVEKKHFYRFEYLRSEHWKDLRISKLASVDAVCARCCVRDTSNDVHHIRYKSLYDVELIDLIVLCRHCHDLVHIHLDNIRNGTFAGENSYQEWQDFVNLWGDRPDRVPELRLTIVEMRKAGKTHKPIDPCAEPRKPYYKEVTLSVELRDYHRFSAIAERGEMSIEDWMLNLARIHESLSRK